MSKSETPKPTNIEELVSRWTQKSGDTQGLRNELELLKVLRDYLYEQYVPFPDGPVYIDRLFTWVDQVSHVSHKQTLFKLATWLLFVGAEEMKSLYRSSYSGIVTRWIIDQAQIDISSSDFPGKLEAAIAKTFFGSLAGMDIGTYCRINDVQQSYRPDFREVAAIGDTDKLISHLQSKGYERVVAVEDYVGGGTQMKEAWRCLRHLGGAQPAPIPLLIMPIISAPKGVLTGNSLSSKSTAFKVEYPLPNISCIPAVIGSGTKEHVLARKARKLFTRYWSQTAGSQRTQPLYGPFGYDGVGSLVLTYLNCPDNVPPAIHHKSDSWEPLFRRTSREA